MISIIGLGSKAHRTSAGARRAPRSYRLAISPTAAGAQRAPHGSHIIGIIGRGPKGTTRPQPGPKGHHAALISSSMLRKEPVLCCRRREPSFLGRHGSKRRSPSDRQTKKRRPKPAPTLLVPSSFPLQQGQTLEKPITDPWEMVHQGDRHRQTNVS